VSPGGPADGTGTEPATRRPTPVVPSPVPAAGRFAGSLSRIQEILDAAAVELYVYDYADGVLYLADQTGFHPPLDELWSRIFVDENLPVTEAIRSGVADVGEFDSRTRAYVGLGRSLAVLGRVACLPLLHEGQAIGLVSASSCTPETGAAELLALLEPELEALTEALAAQHADLLGLIAREIYEPRPVGPGAAEPAASFQNPDAIRAAIPCGTFWWRLGSGVIHLDAIAMSALGAAVPYTGSVMPLLARVDRADYPLLRRTLGEAIAAQDSFAIEYRVNRGDGTVRWIEARGKVTVDELGEPAMVGLLIDTTGRPTWLRLASGQVDAMPDGFAVLDRDWRLVYANETAARTVGLGRAEIIGRTAEEILAPLDPQDWKPYLEQAFETGRQVSFEAFFPTAGRWYEVRAAVDADRIAVHVRDIHEQRIRADRDRIRTRRREQSAAFAAALGGTLGVDDVSEVFELLLPGLVEADGLAMHVVADGRLRLIAAVGYDAAGLSLLRVLDLDDQSAMTDAVRQRRIQVFPRREDLVARDPQMAGVVEVTSTGALLVVPLEYEGSCLGLVCVRFERPRSFNEGYLAFVQRMCGMLVQALYRAHRYDDELSLASRLRDTVFDIPMHAVPGLELASEYRSPGLGLAVGGDWFDVIPLARGRVGLVVGDVEGHDAHAVGGMSTVRTAVRAFAYEGYGPAAILGRVNRLVTELDPDLLATCCYAELDPAQGSARIARAGHPAPVLSTADGSSALIPLPAGLPLGVDPAETYRAVLTPVPPGTLLALYSDGLVESRSVSIDQGTDRLIEALRQHRGVPVADLARQIIEHHFDHTALGDDVTLLLARCEEGPAVPGDPAAE
jgi:PAS domain S-box-containing protein